MDRGQLLKRLERAWTSFEESYAGLSEAQLIECGVIGAWSVKDILAHVTSWEQEALKYLPVILKGERPPRYSVMYGGIHAFNARMTEQNKRLSLADILRQLNETHRRVIEFIENSPEDQFRTDTRFRRRLRADTYGHYPKHAQAIRNWRNGRPPAS